MVFGSSVLFGALNALLFTSFQAAQVNAFPAVTPTESSLKPRADSSYWVSSIERSGTVPFGGNADYKVFRNVKDYGAAGEFD